MGTAITVAVRITGGTSAATATGTTAVIVTATSILAFMVATVTVATATAATTVVTITGTGGRLPDGRVELDARESGTTSRFLLPTVAGGSGTYVVRGAAPLVARPMRDGVAVLESLGVQVDSDGHLPITVTGPIGTDAAVTVRGDVSSQFLSGLLLAAPTWPGGRTIRVEGDLVSRPYVEMTIAVMRAFGASVREAAAGEWVVEGGGYTAVDYAVEPDASAASYFFAAAAICGGKVRVDGLGESSLQGDIVFAKVLERMGASVDMGARSTVVEGSGGLTGGTFDLRDFSDTAPTLAVTAACASGTTEATGIGFIRGKETDRIAAIVTELRRVGVEAEETDDGFVVHPAPEQMHGALVQTYDDHRMAMSFAVLGLRVPGIEIADPGCVAKTFPHFFDVLDTLRA